MGRCLGFVGIEVRSATTVACAVVSRRYMVATGTRYMVGACGKLMAVAVAYNSCIVGQMTSRHEGDTGAGREEKSWLGDYGFATEAGVQLLEAGPQDILIDGAAKLGILKPESVDAPRDCVLQLYGPSKPVCQTSRIKPRLRK